VVGHSAAASELFFKFFQIFFTSKRSSLPPLLGSTNSFTKNPHKRPRSTFLDFKIFRNQHRKENREKSCYLGWNGERNRDGKLRETRSGWISSDLVLLCWYRRFRTWKQMNLLIVVRNKVILVKSFTVVASVAFLLVDLCREMRSVALLLRIGPDFQFIEKLCSCVHDEHSWVFLDFFSGFDLRNDEREKGNLFVMIAIAD